jgi:acyl-CoA synthetase (AMP-forming)/AMP-acid ligase II
MERMIVNNYSNYLPGSNFYATTLVDVLHWRAQHQPNRLAYKFLVDGETEEVNITYKELDKQAQDIAAKLKSAVKIGDRALLIYPPGLEFIAAYMGCLYSGIIAVPIYPPHPARWEKTMPKFMAIVRNANPSIVLTTSSFMSRAATLFTQEPVIKTMRWLTTNQVAEEQTEQWRLWEIRNDSIAFLQYTSGSTSAPRGVMVSHGNLMYNQYLIQRYFEHSSRSQGVIWLPPYHDMGLIGGILQPLYCGFPVTLMSPIVFLQRPFRWLQAISRFRATTSGGPNFAYDLCVRKITPEQRATLDLSSWDVAVNGAEPINCETLERFTEYFRPCGFRLEAFYPCYGLAEATLMVSGGSKAARPILCSFQQSACEQKQLDTNNVKNGSIQPLVGCGQAIMDQEIVIVDPQSLIQCSPGQEGEIWVSGPSVAQGYWNRPDETEYVFRAYLADTGETPFLRTGDLGFLKNGELFVTGRIKDLIIIDGINHYPQDIEWTMERSHPSLSVGSCAAFSIDADGQEQLVVLAEVDPRYYRMCKQQERNRASGINGKNPQTPDVESPIKAIRTAVSKYHDLRIYDIRLLKAGSIFKTSSGKVQRKACREAYLSGSLKVLEV